MKKTLIISMVIGLIATMALASGVMATGGNDGCTERPGAVYEEGIGNGANATRLTSCDVSYTIHEPMDRPGGVLEGSIPAMRQESGAQEFVILTSATKPPMSPEQMAAAGQAVTIVRPGVVLEEGIGGPATRLWVGGFNGLFEPEEPIGGFDEEGSNGS